MSRGSRTAFRVEAAADATLLQFPIPDLLLYIALPRGGAAVDSAVPRMAQHARRLTPSTAIDASQGD